MTPGTFVINCGAGGDFFRYSFSSSQFVLNTNNSITWATSETGGGAVFIIANETTSVLGLRNSTTATKLRLYNTFTTVLTVGEWFKQDWITTANQMRLGTCMGTSTGTARVLSIDYGGLEASPTAAITVPITSGAIVFGGGITLPGGATFLTTNTALTDGAGVGLGTLGTAPAAGNPTKWIGINDNGTTRYIPAW